MATVAMDYSVGALATFDLDTETLTENVSSISGDPVVVMDSGLLWQLNRYQYDTLRKYDPSNTGPLKECHWHPKWAAAIHMMLLCVVECICFSLRCAITADTEHRYVRDNRSSISVNGQMRMTSQRHQVWWLSMINSLSVCNGWIK